MGWLIGAVELIKKLLDFITPWSNYWVDRRKSKNESLDSAKKKLDESAKKGDFDAFFDARSDRDSA